MRRRLWTSVWDIFFIPALFWGNFVGHILLLCNPCPCEKCELKAHFCSDKTSALVFIFWRCTSENSGPVSSWLVLGCPINFMGQVSVEKLNENKKSLPRPGEMMIISTACGCCSCCSPCIVWIQVEAMLAKIAIYAIPIREEANSHSAG